MTQILSGRRCRTIILSTLAAWLVAALQPAWAAPRPIPRDALERLVDGVVADAMAAEHIAGVSVAVVQDGQTVLLKGYGVAGVGPGRPVDPNRTLFRIASISKTFTWIALMKEVERGRVRLDAPVNDYLPQHLKIPDQGFKRPIRVIDLMSHSPGFEDTKLGHLFIEKPEGLTSQAQALAEHRPDRVREPGQVATYSNYGAALAGYIVAQVSGEEYETLVEREILRPLGMNRTTFREPYPPRRGLPSPMPPNLAADVATGFIWGGAGLRPFGFEYSSPTAPAGSASSTAADMARYMQMQLAGGQLGDVRIYGPVTAAAFRTQIRREPPGVNGWAHGFMVRPLPGGRSGYGHGGSLQSFLSNMVLVPDLGLGVFVTTNTSTGRGLVERLPAVIVRSFYAPEVAILRKASPIRDGEARYAGAYYSTRRAYAGPEKFVDLVTANDAVTVTPDGYLITRIGGQVQSWVAEGAPGHFRAADSDLGLVFKLDDRGRAVSFAGARGTFTMERAGPALHPGLYRGASAAALISALALWIAAFVRQPGLVGRAQIIARWVGLVAATLWLVAFGAFASLAVRGADPRIVYEWPGAAATTASWAGLAAAVSSLAFLPAAALALRARALSFRWWLHLLAALAFLIFAALTAARGGLSPWAF